MCEYANYVQGMWEQHYSVVGEKNYNHLRFDPEAGGQDSGVFGAVPGL